MGIGLILRVTAVMSVFVFATVLRAQEGPRGKVTIREIRYHTVATPKFRDTTNDTANSMYEWLQILVEYETEGGEAGASGKDWLDDLQFDWAVMIRSQTGKPLLLKARVNYADVEAGRHYAVVYVRPGIIRRYTGQRRPEKNDFAAYVEIRANGRPGARQEYSRVRTPKGWWQAREPDVRIVDNELLPRDKTPFAAMDYDFYEHIRQTGD